MNKFIGIPALSFVVLTAVVLAACDQGETQAKRPSGMDKTIEGTWFIGEWRNNRDALALPAFRLSSDKLQWGDCTAEIGSLISRDEKRASLVVKEGSTCPANSQGLLKDILLQRVDDCMVSIQLYASAEDIKQGPPQQSAVYTKANCIPPQMD
ncbi:MULTISPECIES: hypothetical protein [unclassified Pseudomonas]|uniref:hypothetical protein n=1 Tax=unclassified Pseudomonas TaxID=196821 RepID=UPI000C881D01|nr:MULTISPECIES: hypothetical protein [unclassified Pseudomonas]PMZ88449.1 hypothetical protein C1X61_13900 [Pseudomonas sp. FW215-T2]PNA16656.1 hypothetical protein C1X62_00765 [Pseudomonas sp. FW215-R3]PNB36403.1 hypothetical protein C1X63_17520 [Pseudomonas sp. FW305-131]